MKKQRNRQRANQKKQRERKGPKKPLPMPRMAFRERSPGLGDLFGSGLLSAMPAAALLSLQHNRFLEDR